ncbi:SPOR domain-containing protein [bacterium]|nr:SPOR domain-containing protein [bacterium]
MENKIIFFKVKPLTISLTILLVLIVFVVFQLRGSRKPQKILSPSETIKEEVLPVAETKLQAEEKPILSLEKKFTIQVASFQDKARAELVANGLKQKGYQSVISSKGLPDKGTWYRVFVGDFDTEDEARSLLEKLKESHKDSFIKLK